MSVSDITPILSLITRLDTSKPQRFSYNQAAYDNNEIEGVETFNVLNDQNIPASDKTAYDSHVLDQGARSQGASLPRMAWNHFIGRFSYNLAKLTQQVLSFFGFVQKAWAHNAHEYDNAQTYLLGDVCYLIGTIGAVTTVEFYQRISASPLELVGVPPVTAGNADWAPVMYRTEAFPLVPINSTGYRHRYSIVDLTGGTYLTTTWYPVTVGPVGGFGAAVGAVGGEDAETLIADLEAFTVGTVAGFGMPCRAELSVSSKFSGFASGSSSVIYNNSFVSNVDGTDNGVTNSPIGYSVLPLGQQAVLWLKGGSKYAVWNSFGQPYTVRTASYNNGLDPAVAPSLSRIFSYTTGKINAVIGTPNAVNTDEAVNLGQINTLNATQYATLLRKMKKADNKVPFRELNRKDKNLFVQRWWSESVPTLVTNWQAVAWSPELSLFCMLDGSSGIIATSPDGTIWTLGTITPNQSWDAICWSAELGLFCAVGTSTDKAATSPDGIVWNQRILPVSQNWTSICWSPELGIFCTVSSGGLSNAAATSSTGIIWTARTLPSSQTWNSVCWSSELGLFCAVAAASAAAATSPDGINWTNRTLPSSSSWRSVCWSAELGLFCAVAAGPSTIAATSPDGITWTARTLPSSALWNNVLWVPELGLFLATNSSGASSMATSTDGVLWTLRTITTALVGAGAWGWGTWAPEIGTFVFPVTSTSKVARSLSLKEF